ncbi:sodium-dependent transporter bedraggled isoform X2 [Dendroctonus ponderosae]|uniref:Transporter n=1 Tax=Dendroctonus ponderosae TaxID=77166 RepID=A0AAR5Q639_DENPD|nr:sodium-dependent transporter bedraggled isoform X2 [Dendroctonus ponderosae]KAH1022786.1 hypothetical protein HUJ04_012130 [Dendroctonus ponderosae]KAH1029232.1 hypothetical protein HUJ05_002505 [Dendroctonus ponderosae]
MSTSAPQQDLIDFHVGAPEPPGASEPPFSCESESLIDTDLPVFEQKLLTHSSAACPHLRKNSIDVEDILIDFDDCFDKDSLDGEAVEVDDFLPVCEGVEDEAATLPVDNFEALLVLKNLDDLLNATLDESLDSNGNVDDDAQSIEECLEDLDNYLQAIENYETESEESYEQSLQSADIQEPFDEELERRKLRQIEENYRKFVASGIVNRAFTDTENNGNFTPANQSRRPSSACAMPDRKQPLRASTVNAPRRQRPRVTRRKSLGEHFVAPHRTSETDAPGDCPVLTNDVSRERHAYASAERCTGTVIVEPLHRQCEEASSSAYAVIDETVSPDTRRTPWVRTSMRRLQQVALPTSGGQEGRPVSAPSRLPPPEPTGDRGRALSGNSDNRPRSASTSSRSQRARSPSSSTTSIVSSVDSAQSRLPPLETATTTNADPSSSNNSPRRACERANEMPEAESPLGKWPHSLSSMMACLGCTLGLFNISRFAVLTIHFGANFIFQFILLSLVFGLPLFTLQLCLGQQLGTGVIDMWRISPLFQGVGVSLLITQALTGLYSIVGVSWMFVYFQDSFITAVDKYRWAQPFIFYRKDAQPPINGSYKLSETVPDYFSGVVLQRYHLPNGVAYGTIKFQSAFNLAVVWTVIFVSLSKGLRSYGKVIYVFTLLPVFGTFVLCAKILGLMPPEFVNIIFPETSWGEFFLNSRSWLAAAQETFLTWGLLGAAIMQIASHNKHKHLLQRDSSLIAVITISVLLLMAFLANTCVQILRSYGYSYYPSSFERITSYQFLRQAKDSLPATISNTPVRYMRHNSFILGEQVIRPGADGAHESGYQVLRLATEILPATFAVMGADQVSPFWAVLTYFILIMFGIAQQLAIWHCVITGIMAIKPKVLKKWDSTITFFSCACGFILGLPMATELGIYVVYFMDYTLGSIWWLVIVIVLQIMAVFLVRGRPYSGDTVVTALFSPNNHSYIVSWAPPLLAFNWNVILPVVLTVLCIATFKNGSFRDMFIWHHVPFADYWPLWARQLGSMMQLLPVLCVPFVAVIQSYRYLNNGPTDILDRIQLLYRPPLGEHMEDISVAATMSAANPTNLPSEDPPPKYTPPPSYTTATGARLAKFLRQSIRRSMRRIVNVLGEGSSSAGTSRSRPSVQNVAQAPPPNYNAVFVEMNVSINPDDADEARISTLERLRNLQGSPNALTAAEVASILRSSFRRSRMRSPASSPEHRDFDDHGVGSLSAEHLVDAAAPIGETSLVIDHVQDQARKAHNEDLSVI